MKPTFVLILSFISAFCKAQPPDPSPNYLPFLHDGKWGFIDTTGSIMVPARYTYVGIFSEGLALACEDGKCGYINGQGEFIIPPLYEEGASFINGIAFVRTQNGSMLIKHDNQILLRSDSRYLSTRDSLYLFTKGELWGVYNARSQRICIEPVYEWIDFFSEGLAAFLQNDKMGYLNLAGEVVIHPAFDDAREFHEGLAAVRQNELYGFINTKGKFVIEPAFSHAGFFLNGVASAKSRPAGYHGDEQSQTDQLFSGEADKTAWGFIDKKGKWIVAPRYSHCHLPVEGFYRVYEAGKSGLVDLSGNVVIPLQEGDISFIGKEQIVIVNGSGAQFCHRDGSPLFTVPGVKMLNPVHTDYFWFSPNCQSNDWRRDEGHCLFGILNDKGKIIWEPID